MTIRGELTLNKLGEEGTTRAIQPVRSVQLEEQPRLTESGWFPSRRGDFSNHQKNYFATSSKAFTFKFFFKNAFSKLIKIKAKLV